MKYSIFSVTERITKLTKTEAHDKSGVRLSTLLIKGSIGTFVLKIISTGLAFATSLLLSRLLGAKGYGIYAYAIAWVALLAVPSTLGLNRLLVREVAVYHTQSEWGLMRGILRRASQAVVIVSLGLTFLAVFGTWVFAGRLDSQMLTSFWIALIMLPLITLTSLRQAALRGLKKVVTSQLPEMFIQPMLFISLIIVAYLLFEKSFRPSWAVGMNVVATGVVLVIGAGLLYKTLPQPVKKASPEYKTRMWVHSALPLLFVAGMQVINAKTDTIMLGVIKGTKTVGVYSVAIRGSELITFILFSVNTVLAPTIASLYAARDMKQLQLLITKSARMILLISLPIGLGLILFSHRFLSLFGYEFTQGGTALIILSIGQLINATMGSVSLLLVMTNYERDAALGIGISASLNVVLNAILIPLWGLEGAATATTTSMIVWNILLAIWVYKRLGIHSTAFGKISLRRSYEKT